MRKRRAMSERVEKAPDKKREDGPWEGIDDPFQLFLTERSSTSKYLSNCIRQIVCLNINIFLMKFVSGPKKIKHSLFSENAKENKITTNH